MINVVLDVLRPNDLGAVRFGAVSGVRRSKLVDLEIEVLDEFLRQHDAVCIQWDL